MTDSFEDSSAAMGKKKIQRQAGKLHNVTSLLDPNESASARGLSADALATEEEDLISCHAS